MDPVPPEPPGQPGDRSERPTDADLLAAILGEATPGQQALIGTFASDPIVSQRQVQLRQMLDTLRSVNEFQGSFQISAAQRERLCSLAPLARTGLAATLAAGTRQIAALLTFDNWRANTSFAGYRGGSSGERLLRYEADGWVIDVRISPESIPGRWLVQCDCAGDKLSAARLSPLSDPRTAVYFELSGGTYAEGTAQAGVYCLELAHAGGLLVIEPLTVGDELSSLAGGTPPTHE